MDLLANQIEETNVVDRKHLLTNNFDFDLVDQTIHHLLQELFSLDPKFNFIIRNLSTIDSENVNIRQFYYFLIWKELSRGNVCRLVNDDGYFSSIELLKYPKTWSKNDINAYVINIGKQKILNGLSLRDDLLKNLVLILKSNETTQSTALKFTHFEFETSLISLYFEAKFKKPLITVDEPLPKVIPEYKVTYIISLTPILSFSNATPLIINSLKERLSHHEFFKKYFDNFAEKKFYLLAFNSYKWAYDVVYSEDKLFKYILSERANVISQGYRRLVSIKQSWRKYFDKSLQAVENAKAIELQRQEQSVMNVMKGKKAQYRRAKTTVRKIDLTLSSKFEMALERTLNEYIFRVLFLRECSRLEQTPSDRQTFNQIILTNTLEQLLHAFEHKHCESFSLKFKNIMPKVTLQFENCINIGICKLIKEIILDWKRGKFGY